MKISTKIEYTLAFSSGKGTYEEIARAKLHESLEIELSRVSDLLKTDRELPTSTTQQKTQRTLTNS